MAMDDSENKPKPLQPNAQARPSKSKGQTWFVLPKPVRQVFDRFPLRTKSTEPLPQRAPRRSSNHVLYLFHNDTRHNAATPSCNPSCLRWQAYLRFQDIPFITRASNNHASPTGALPFLLPAGDSDRPSTPVTTSKIAKWVTAQGKVAEPLRDGEEAYSSLIDHVIRNAWLFHLYLDEGNFETVAYPLYVVPSSSNMFVRATTARQLRAAARDELLKCSKHVDPENLYGSVNQAFSALSSLLGGQDYFFGVETPGIFDASLFAYTRLILDQSLDWHSTILSDLLRKYENLVQHEQRLSNQYFNS